MAATSWPVIGPVVSAHAMSRDGVHSACARWACGMCAGSAAYSPRPEEPGFELGVVPLGGERPRQIHPLGPAAIVRHRAEADPAGRAIARWGRRWSYFSRRISRTCLIDSLSVMSVGDPPFSKGPPYLRAGWATDERSGSEFAITIPGIGDHDAPESMIRIDRNERSGSAGTGDQDASEPSADTGPRPHSRRSWRHRHRARLYGRPRGPARHGAARSRGERRADGAEPPAGAFRQTLLEVHALHVNESVPEHIDGGLGLLEDDVSEERLVRPVLGRHLEKDDLVVD